MDKKTRKSRKLALSKQTLRSLEQDNLSEIHGGWTNITFTVATFSIRYCGSRNGCASLDPPCA